MAPLATPCTAAVGTPVPMLDINRQNAPLRPEIDAAIARVCDSGAFVHGPACQEFETALAEYCGAKHAVGCASGSDALLLALMALDLRPGDEVLLPSFTFFATASAVTRLGATPVFVDILPETFNINPADAIRKITPMTRAILPVHLFGQCADMDAILHLAGEIPVIEDAAQAIGAEHRGARAGSIGTLGCFSFYPTKNLGGFGDGGMITTDDESLAERLRILRDHGQHPRYHHHVVGVNSRLDAIQAAVLNVKLSHLESYAEARRANAARYQELFRAAGIDRRIGVPTESAENLAVWNQFTIRIPGGQREELQRHLAEQKIGSAIYYPIPLHLQECFANLEYKVGDLPATERACREVLSLPIYEGLTIDEQNRVVTAIGEFFGIEVELEDATDASQHAA